MATSLQINIQASSNSYPIEIAEGNLLNLAERVKSLQKDKNSLPKMLLITHPHLYELYGKDLKEKLGENLEVELIESGETSKSWKNAERILQRMIDLQFNRESLVLALGGGVVGDLSGFISSVFFRGIPFIQIPTSLLAMVDSSVGGKTAVNLGSFGKNLVGAFYQPSLVLIDLQTLKSLPEQEWKNGLGEVLKYSLLKNDDGKFFEWLQSNIQEILARDNLRVIEEMVKVCVETKAKIVEEDEKEKTGTRILLNLGHTFAHVLEVASSYKIPHGEAVSIGLVLSAYLAYELGEIQEEDKTKIIEHVKSFNLSYQVPKSYKFQADQLVRYFVHDKKADQSGIRFIVPFGKISQSKVIKNIPEDLLIKVFQKAL